jgi:hypothetical protein
MFGHALSRRLNRVGERAIARRSNPSIHYNQQRETDGADRNRHKDLHC